MTTTTTPAADLTALTRAARVAQRSWAELPVRDRLAPVERFRRAIVAKSHSLIGVLGEELGKSVTEVLGGEVLATADACRFLTRQAAALLRPRRVPGRLRPIWLQGQRDEVHRRPRGVVGIIGTWNYPLFLNGVQVMHAMTAGNAVVWKPSEVAPLFAVLMAELVAEAGFPEGLFHALPATREMGAALAEADVDHVVFTGSAAVGRKLAARLGERLVSSTMELSGCDAQFVLEDADVPLAARAAWFGANANKGQTCIAVRRAFVHRSVYPAFSEALAAMVGQGGPVQLEMASQEAQVESLLHDAASEGGRVLRGPELANVPGLRPAVVLDATPAMAVCREAAFAPVMAVLPYGTIGEALAMEAECPYALGASIFTRDTSAAARLAARLRAGAVTVNDVIVPTAHPATPFGGRGASGWGVTQGAEGLLEMTVPQVVSVRGGTFRPHYDTTPEQQLFSERLLRATLDLSHGETLGARIGGAWRLLKALLGGK
jgi:acyl-CoA reductase-like NAD-dependent aldehyde dehydrogenase